MGGALLSPLFLPTTILNPLRTMNADTTNTQADPLSEIREEWEEGLTVCSVLPPADGRQLVILSGFVGDPDYPEDQQLVYHCHRYFEMGTGNWTCSVDANCVPLEGVWEWLRDPRALPLKRINELRNMI